MSKWDEEGAAKAEPYPHPKCRACGWDISQSDVHLDHLCGVCLQGFKRWASGRYKVKEWPYGPELPEHNAWADLWLEAGAPFKRGSTGAVDTW